MAKVLILSAHGQIARAATDLFLERTDARLALYLRNARRLKQPGHEERVNVVEGDVLDTAKLEEAMAGHEVVYAILAGQLEQQARTIVRAMEKTGVRRLIFISSMGIYDEVPGERQGAILDPYRKAAQAHRGIRSRLHHPAASLAQRPQWNRIWNHAKRRVVQERRRDGVAQERRRPCGETGDDAGPGGPKKPGHTQGAMIPAACDSTSAGSPSAHHSHSEEVEDAKAQTRK